MKKSRINQIVKEEVDKFLQEQDNLSNTQMRENLEEAIAQLGQHAELLKEAAYYISSQSNEQDTIIQAIKAHGAYIRSLEQLIEALR